MAIIVFLDCDDADDDALSTFLLSQPLDPHTLPNHQVVIPIGPMPPEALAAYTSLITRHASVQAQALRSFYRSPSPGPGPGGGGGGGGGPPSSFKSPFRSYPWKSGRLRLRYLPPQVPVPRLIEEEEGEGEEDEGRKDDGAPPPVVFRPPLAALHLHRRALGVIGICHCPSLPRSKSESRKKSSPSGLSRAHAAFERALLSYPDAGEALRFRALGGAAGRGRGGG